MDDYNSCSLKIKLGVKHERFNQVRCETKFNRRPTLSEWLKTISREVGGLLHHN